MFKIKKPEEDKIEVIKPRKAPQEEEVEDAGNSIDDEEPQRIMS
jgi:hypothetical protein